MTVLQRVAFEQSRATALDSAWCLLSAFRMLGLPKSMIDIGCGPGHLVTIAAALGVDSAGVDINHDPAGAASYCYVVDLTAPLPPHILAERDLVLCWEVAEHLPPEAADTLCDTLASCVAPGGVLLFTAAVPGQGGAGHLNEQPTAYWQDKLERRGLALAGGLTRELRQEWQRAKLAAWWYAQNLIAMVRT